MRHPLRSFALALLLFVAQIAPASANEAASSVRVRIVALSDFHGWLMPLEPHGFSRYYGGIANLAGMLAHKEKLGRDDSLIIDNGDMWTGPTESTLLRGESVVAAYNALGVAAVNLGNHEFDFGVEVLRTRTQQATFPFLGANLVDSASRAHPDFVKPWTIVERAGVKIGVLGLCFVDTPKTTQAKYVTGLEFHPYEATLAKFVPELSRAGAEIVVVLFHDTADVVRATLEKMPDLGIHAVVAGQSHRKESLEVRGTPISNPGPFGRSYARFDVAFDKATRKVTRVDAEIVDVTGEVGAPLVPPSVELASIAETAHQKAKSLSSDVLGRLERPLPVGTFANSPLGNFIVDAWLKALPAADFAILNHGGIRQPLAAGRVTLGDLIGVMPFENNLVLVDLTGKQLEAQLAIDSPVVGGLTFAYRESGKRRVVRSIVDASGKKLRPDATYKVAIIDFMYTGGDGFEFENLDSTPEDTGVSWREPVITALRAIETEGRALLPRVGARARRATHE